MAISLHAVVTCFGVCTFSVLWRLPFRSQHCSMRLFHCRHKRVVLCNALIQRRSGRVISTSSCLCSFREEHVVFERAIPSSCSPSACSSPTSAGASLSSSDRRRSDPKTLSPSSHSSLSNVPICSPKPPKPLLVLQFIN